MSIWVILCGVFYAVLCVFSVITGILYFTGNRELNPIELSERMVKKLSTKEKKKKFWIAMWYVTFLVWIVQGITAYALLFSTNIILYYFAVWFTVFSVCSVVFKLKWKINNFSLMKFVFYVIILVILLIGLN